jgi:hypothetical protein
MIPVVLERREQVIQGEGKGRKHYILHINLQLSLIDLQKYAAIDSTKIMLELPAPEESKEDILQQTNEIIDSEPAEKESPKEIAPKEQSGKNKIDAATVRKIEAMGKSKNWDIAAIEAYIKEIWGKLKIEELNNHEAETLFNYLKQQ